MSLPDQFALGLHQTISTLPQLFYIHLLYLAVAFSGSYAHLLLHELVCV